MVRMPLPVVRKSASAHDFLRGYPDARVLNLGGCGMPGAINYDLGPSADVVGDAHDLSVFPDGSFDCVVSTGMLQYCHTPAAVASEIHRVLRPGGLVYVDVPFVQPYCDHHGVEDLWRFTDRGLRRLFRDFDVIECGSSIPAVSALGFYVDACAKLGPRCASLPLRLALSLSMGAAAMTKLGRSPDVAGALYLIGRKAGRT